MSEDSYAAPATKSCSRCKDDKPVDQFGVHRRNPDGLHYWCRPCARTMVYSKGKQCPGCGVLVSNYATRCQKCVPRGAAHHSYTGRYTRKQDGYVVVTGYHGYPNADAKGHILEHVYVMSQHLGRPLAKGENVHHKNGQRGDNRIGNLELWSTSQPQGQRIADKVAWAREILRMYADYEDPSPESDRAA